ncbi:phosphatases II [Meredithblackwellia eburnea MCA 4105]
MGVGERSKAWRVTSINKDFSFCPTYPSSIIVPSKISDTTLGYAVKYRSKGRIPGLVYLHWGNLGSITRSSQPMVGLKLARSIQDEKLIESIFTSHSQHTTATAPRHTFTLASSSSSSLDLSSPPQIVYGAQSTNLIIDARPTTNAVANSVKGAGTENMDHYRNCRKAYLGIDNIHVMRSSLSGVFEALAESETTGHLDLSSLRRTSWLKHLTSILEGILTITRTIHLSNSHVLVHCSDGWDRTSQLSSIAQLCLDPYYRTGRGFAVLVEKDWLSYGHRFSDRTGHYCVDRTQFINTPSQDQSAQSAFLASMQKQFSGSSHAFKETCPVFQQFLDCVYQIMRQFPARFEFGELFLRRLCRELYEGRFGTFLFNSERERELAKAKERTGSVWEEMFDLEQEGEWKLKEEYKKGEFDPKLDDRDSRELNADQGVLMVDPLDVRWWFELFQRGDEEMNGKPEPEVQEEEEAEKQRDEITIVEGGSQDPGLAAAMGKVSLSPSSTSPAFSPGSANQRTLSPSPAPSPVPRSPSPFAQPQPQQPQQSFADSFSQVQAQAPVQLAAAVSSVQKFGWGAWKAAQKSYNEYRESQGSVSDAGGAGGEGHSRTLNGESSSGSNLGWKAIDFQEGELKDPAAWGSASAGASGSGRASRVPSGSNSSTAPSSPTKPKTITPLPPPQAQSSPSYPVYNSLSSSSASRSKPTPTFHAAEASAGWSDIPRESSTVSNPWDRERTTKSSSSSGTSSPVKTRTESRWMEEKKDPVPPAGDSGDPLGVGLG